MPEIHPETMIADRSGTGTAPSAVEIAIPEPWPLTQDTLAYECPWHEGRIELYWLIRGSVKLVLYGGANVCLLTFISPVIPSPAHGHVRLETNEHAPEIVLAINGETVLSHTSQRLTNPTKASIMAA